MDSSLSIRVFEWRSELHCTVDRVGRSDHRKYAPRTRLAGFTLPLETEPSEVDACLWALLKICDLLGVSMDQATESPSASPGGDRRGRLAARRASSTSPLYDATVKNAHPPLCPSVGEAVSVDGLKPQGATPTLW